MNRQETFRNGPRKIDNDILCGFDENSKEIYLNECDLEIPHKRMFERNFVLVPLNDMLSKQHKNKLNYKNISKYRLIY